MTEVREFLEEFVKEPFVRAVFSGQRRFGEPSRVKVRPVEIKGMPFFQAEVFSGTQVFHTNHPADEIVSYMEDMCKGGFSQLQLWGRTKDGSILISRKGKMTVRTRPRSGGSPAEPVKLRPHNRVKNYILREGTPVPFLVDLGVMNEKGDVMAARYDKFRQINRFLEFIEDVLPALPHDREVTILDFGCGKSYLTFAMYYYLKELKEYDVRIIGLDLKADVIEKCNGLARKYGFRKLSFLQGDIAEYQGVTAVDMVVTLHACDTATDFALEKAVEWGAQVILSVPCCQHELNRQIKNELLQPVLKYGILKERMAALITDGIRANLLESRGYDTQILEFIQMEHTPKNLLIRGIKRGGERDPEKARELMKALNASLTLDRLLAAGEDSGKYSAT